MNSFACISELKVQLLRKGERTDDVMSQCFSSCLSFYYNIPDEFFYVSVKLIHVQCQSSKEKPKFFIYHIKQVKTPTFGK